MLSVPTMRGWAVRVASSFAVASSAAEGKCDLELVMSSGLLSVLRFGKHAIDQIVGG